MAIMFCFGAGGFTTEETRKHREHGGFFTTEVTEDIEITEGFATETQRHGDFFTTEYTEYTEGAGEEPLTPRPPLPQGERG